MGPVDTSRRAVHIPPQLWTCPACGVALATVFCSGCGERQLAPHDLTLRGLALLVYKAFSPVDGRVMRSFQRLLAAPGTLTAAFQQGLRKPYIGPFQIFLVANVVFFAVQSFSTMRIFTASLDFRLHGQLWSDFGQTLVDQRLAATGRTFAQYAPVFDQAVAVNAKSLIGLMVPPFALLLPLVFWRRGSPLVVHMVFSLHFYAFLLVLMCVPLAGMWLSAMVGGAAVMPQRVDDAMSVALVLSCGAYLFVAIGPVYGAGRVTRAIQALLLTFAVVGIFLIYRFALLPITLYTT